VASLCQAGVGCSVSTNISRAVSWSGTLVGVLLGILPLLYAQSSQPRGVSPLPSPAGSLNQQRGSYYALVIGINSYQNLPRLQTPLNDAEAIASTLSDKYGFKTQLLRDATRDQILRALGNYRGSLHENDNLLIYYAGHGYYDRAADQAYWFPVDAEKNNSSRHVLVVSDSCYSGMLTRDVSGTLWRDARTTLGDPVERDAYLQKLMQGKSRYVMASPRERTGRRQRFGRPRLEPFRLRQRPFARFEPDEFGRILGRRAVQSSQGASRGKIAATAGIQPHPRFRP